MTKVIYGDLVSTSIKEKLKEEVALLKENKKRMPLLCVILVGNNVASLSYIKGKERASQEIGIDSRLIKLPSETSEEELISLIKNLNEDKSVDGILVQMPLPKHINENTIMKNISYKKDVDGLNIANIGLLQLGEDGLFPCTPLGILELLKTYNIEMKSKHAVIVGRSKLVGLPVSKLLLDNNATVTMCHSHTADLKMVCNQADILIVAIGKAKYIDDSYIKEGAVVIDVGINRGEDGKLCGDVDYESVFDKASYITPVPKGVGPMTIAMLLANTLKAYKKNEEENGL